VGQIIDPVSSSGYDLKQESTALQSRIQAIPDLREVFCHNDLLIYNIIHDEKKGLCLLNALSS